MVDSRNEFGSGRDSWEASRRYGLHHAIVNGNTAYAAWRDAGMLVLDVTDRGKPTPIVHRNWSPPFGGGTHNCLPLADRELLVVLDEAVLDHQEDGLKLIWVFDNRVAANPVSIATLPTPAEADYKSKGGHFGPHNIHENRPGAALSRRSLFSRPIRMPASGYSISRTRSHPKRSAHWCRLSRRASPTPGQTAHASFSQPMCLSMPPDLSTPPTTMAASTSWS